MGISIVQNKYKYLEVRETGLFKNTVIMKYHSFTIRTSF